MRRAILYMQPNVYQYVNEMLYVTVRNVSLCMYVMNNYACKSVSVLPACMSIYIFLHSYL